VCLHHPAKIARAAEPPDRHLSTEADDVDRTLLLAVLRGCLLDLLATGDVARTSAAVDRYLRMIDERRVEG
jgi:hypothetical protein